MTVNNFIRLRDGEKSRFVTANPYLCTQSLYLQGCCRERGNPVG